MEEVREDRNWPRASFDVSLPSSWPPMALEHDCHTVFDAGTKCGKTGRTWTKGARQKPIWTAAGGAGAIALLGGRQKAFVASSVLVVHLGRMASHIVEAGRIGRSWQILLTKPTTIQLKVDELNIFKTKAAANLPSDPEYPRSLTREVHACIAHERVIGSTIAQHSAVSCSNSR